MDSIMNIDDFIVCTITIIAMLTSLAFTAINKYNDPYIIDGNHNIISIADMELE